MIQRGSFLLIGALAGVVLLALLPLARADAPAQLPGRAQSDDYPFCWQFDSATEGRAIPCPTNTPWPTWTPEETVTYEPPPTFTPPVYASPTPSPAATDTATPEPSPTPEVWTVTPTPSLIYQCTVEVETGYTLRVRSGPGIEYGVIGALQNGTVIVIEKISEDNAWHRIDDPVPGWVAGDYVTCGWVVG